MPAGDASRVVVTAGASGIGLAIALEFLEAGAKVWVCDVDAAAIAGIRSPEPVTQAGVSRRLGSCCTRGRHFFIAMLRDLGGIDVLVNNAGVARPEPADRRRLACRVGALLRRQRRWYVSLLPCGDSYNEGATQRLHHQYLHCERAHRSAAAHALCGIEVRRARFDRQSRARVGTPWHPLQRHPSRAHRQCARSCTGEAACGGARSHGG